MGTPSALQAASSKFKMLRRPGVTKRDRHLQEENPLAACIRNHGAAMRKISLPLILDPMQREAIELMQVQTRERLLRIHSFSYIKSRDNGDMQQRKK